MDGWMDGEYAEMRWHWNGSCSLRRKPVCMASAKFRVQIPRKTG